MPRSSACGALERAALRREHKEKMRRGVPERGLNNEQFQLHNGTAGLTGVGSSHFIFLRCAQVGNLM
jgi:hypothetical protein